MTLIELLVVIAILGTVGTVASVAFSIGLKALGPGGARDRIAGAHDVAAFETQLGADVTRAGCIAVPSLSVATNYFGDCNGIRAASPIPCTIPSNAFLCIGWPRSSDSRCHVAVYSQSGTATNTVTRREYTVPTGGAATVTVYGTTIASVTTPTAAVVTPNGAPTPTAPAGGLWPSGYRITVTSGAVTLQKPTGAMVFRPLSEDPAAGTGYTTC